MSFTNIKLPSNKKFGFFFSCIFAIIASYLFFKKFNELAIIFYVLAFLFFILAIFKSELLLPLNKLWMRFGFILSLFVNPIILGLIYFGLFTPISLISKIFKRDELGLKVVNKNSYWKKTNNNTKNFGKFKNQF